MNATILIADDEPDTVQMLTAWLQGDGYRTLAAINGREALAVAIQEQPDLILLDVSMPVMDGLEVCRRLRANPATSAIPAILVTAKNPTEARAEGVLAGAVDYITKPINLPDLSQRVASILAAEGHYRVDASRLLDELAHSALVMLSCDLAWLLEVDPEEHRLESRALALVQGEQAAAQFLGRLGEAAAVFQIPLAESSSPLADVMANRRVVLDMPVAQLRGQPGIPLLDQALTELGLKYIHLVPLTVGHRAVGMLVLGVSERSQLDSPRGWQLVTTLGSQAAIVLDYMRLSQNLVEQEEMMEAEQAFLRMILDSMGDGLVVISEKAEIEYINNRLLRMAGYASAEVLGQQIGMLFHPEDRAEVMRSLLRGPGATMKFDQRLYTKTGRVIPVLLSRSSFAKIDPEARQQVLVLSDLTEQKVREETLERQSQQLRALNQAAEAITSSLSPREVITRILNAATDMVNAEGASVLLRAADNPEELRFVAAVGPEAETIQGMRVPLGQGIAGWVAREAESQLVADTSKDDRFYRNIDQLSGVTTRTLIAVPLIVADKVIGVLEAINKREGVFDQVDQDLLESIAGTAAIAIENSRLFEQTRRRLVDLGTLLDASAAVSSTLDLGSVLELIARRLVDALQVERCVISAWDRTTDVLESLAEVTDAYWPPGSGPVSQLSQQPLRQAALASGLPVLMHVDDASGHPSQLQELRSVGQQAILAMPLWIDDRVVGLMVLFSSLVGHAFTDADAERVDQIVRTWSKGVGDNAEALWRTRKHSTELCNKLHGIPGVTWVSIEEWLPDQNVTCRLRESGFALWDEHGGVRQNLADFSTMRRVLSIAQPKVVTLADLNQDPQERRLLERIGGRVCLIAPLIIRGAPEGLVKLIDSDSARTFDSEQISLCQGIANVVGNAMENAHLYQSLERRADALEQAFAELKRADQLKDELLQNLSHEIQTPLLHVLGYTELMYSGAFGPLNDEQRDKLRFVVERAQHLSGLAKNIIAMQALQSQKIELSPTDLKAVVQQAVRSWTPEAAKHSLTIATQMPANAPLVMADARQLTEAIENLLENAIKFSPAGGRVEIAVREQDTALQVSVSDQGIGIPREAQSRIFERFYQADGSATRQYGGTGLGLAIVHEIITQHGGQIWVESEPGQGSTFIFTVPKASSGALVDHGGLRGA